MEKKIKWNDAIKCQNNQFADGQSGSVLNGKLFRYFVVLFSCPEQTNKYDESKEKYKIDDHCDYVMFYELRIEVKTNELSVRQLFLFANSSFLEFIRLVLEFEQIILSIDTYYIALPRPYRIYADISDRQTFVSGPCIPIITYIIIKLYLPQYQNVSLSKSMAKRFKYIQCVVYTFVLYTFICSIFSFIYEIIFRYSTACRFSLCKCVWAFFFLFWFFCLVVIE